MRRFLLAFTVALITTFSLLPTTHPTAIGSSPINQPISKSTGTGAALEAYGKLPLSFMPNLGQTDPSVYFQVRGLGGTLFFTPGEIVLTLPGRPLTDFRPLNRFQRPHQHPRPPRHRQQQ